MMPTTQTLQTLQAAAETALQALEALPLDAPYARALAAADAALAALQDRARDQLFPPRLEPADPGTLLDFQILTADVLPRSAPADLAARHAEAYPALQGLIRGIRGQRLLRAALAASTASLAEGLAAFEQAVAGQLVGQAAHEPAASLLAHELPAGWARAAAARTAHEAHAQQETARRAAERDEAARVLADAREARRRALQARAEQVGPIYVPGLDSGNVVTPWQLRAAIATADDTLLVELEAAITGAEAARAARAAGAVR
jgi:hypothetical protein